MGLKLSPLTCHQSPAEDGLILAGYQSLSNTEQDGEGSHPYTDGTLMNPFNCLFW